MAVRLLADVVLDEACECNAIRSKLNGALDLSGLKGNDAVVIRGEQPEGDPDGVERTEASLGEASLRRGLEILGLFSMERPWLQVGEIASELGLSPLDAHAQVAAMRRMHLVRQGPGRRYGLGPGPPDLAMDAIRAAGIARRAHPHLLALQRRTGCAVTLTMLDGTELMLLDRAIGAGGEAEMAIGLDRHPPLHATAPGKVLLAYLPEHYEQKIVPTLDLEAFTPRTIVDARLLLRHLQEIRMRGLATEDREHLPHRRCLAAPVRGAGRHVVAALGMRLKELDPPLGGLVQEHCDALLDAAAQLSSALCYAQPDWHRL